LFGTKCHDTECNPCEKGYYSSSGDAQCKKCEINTLTDKEAQSQCKKSNTDEYTDEEGATLCIKKISMFFYNPLFQLYYNSKTISICAHAIKRLFKRISWDSPHRLHQQNTAYKLQSKKPKQMPGKDYSRRE